MANELKQQQSNEKVQEAGNPSIFRFVAPNKSSSFKNRASPTLNATEAHDISKKTRAIPKTQKPSPEPPRANDQKQNKVAISRHAAAYTKAPPKVGSSGEAGNNLRNSLNIHSFQAQIEQKKLEDAVLRQEQQIGRGLKRKRSSKHKPSKKLSIIKDIEGRVSQDDSNRIVQRDSVPTSNISSQNEQDLHILHVKLDSKLPKSDSRHANEEMLES